jgi:WD40 repeat protein
MNDPAVGAGVRRVARLRAANPAAADLAVLLSTAVRIEPELVRRIRLLVPGADVGAEADLWASDLLASASPLAISFEPVVAEALRAELAGPAYDRLREAAGRTIESSHAGLHWSLRLEEEINRLMVGGEPDALDKAEQLLYAALAELRSQSAAPDADAVPVARWLLAALARMPRAAAATEAGVVAELSAGAQLDRRFEPPSGRSAVVEAWMPWLLGAAGVTPYAVPVRFPTGRLDINSPGPGAVTIDVPATTPMVLGAVWHDGNTVRHQRVRFGRDEYVTLPIAVDRVELETLAGGRYRLIRPTHGARSQLAVQGLDFSAVRAGLRPCLDREDMLERIVDAADGDRWLWIVLSGPAGAGKSVLLGAALDRLERDGYAVVQHFYGIHPTWDDPGIVAASLAAKLASAVDAREPARHDLPPRQIVELALESAARLAKSVGRPGIVVALDGLPGRSNEDVERFMTPGVPVPSKPPPGVRYLVTTRYGGGVRDWLEDGDPIIGFGVADPSMRQVCEQILASERAKLDAALGVLQANPDEAWARRSATLIELSGGVPGRLVAIIGWLGEQPAGTARLEAIPPSLTVRIDATLTDTQMPWLRDWLGVIAVAWPGFTVADLRMATGGSQDDTTTYLDTLAQLGLVRQEPSALGATVAVIHPSVVDAYAERFGRDAITEAHRRHVAAFPREDPSAATPYQIVAAVHHHIGAGDHELTRALAHSATFLDRRQRAAGVTALLADLDALSATTGDADIPLISRAIANVAGALQAEPTGFVDLAYNALCQLGAVDLAESVVRDTWRPALRVRAVHSLASDGLVWRDDNPVTAVFGWSPDGFVALAGGSVTVHRVGGTPNSTQGPQRPSMATRWGRQAAVADGSSIALINVSMTPDRAELLDGGGARVTSLVAITDTLIAGRQDGTLTTFTRGDDGALHRRHLMGHARAVTALAIAPAGLVSASEDGTVRVWSLAEGRIERVYRRHKSAVVKLAVLDSGDVVSCEVRGRVRWWDLSTGEDRRVLGAHADAATAVVPVSNGTALVTTGCDGAVRRWDLTAPQGEDKVLHPGGPSVSHAVRCPATPDQPEAVAGWCTDGRLTWWDATDGRILRTIRPDRVVEPVRGLLYDEASRTVVLAHASGLLAFDASTSTPDVPGPVALGALALSPDGRVAAVGVSHGVDQVDVTDGTVISRSAPGSPAASVAYETDAVLMLVRQDGTVEVAGNPWTRETPYRRVVSAVPWQTPAWVQTAEGRVYEVPDPTPWQSGPWQFPPSESMASESLAPESMASKSMASQLPPSASPPSESPPVGRFVDGPRQDTSALAAMTDSEGGWVAAGDPDGTVRLLQVPEIPAETGMAIVSSGNGATTTLAFAVSGRWLVTGNADGTLRRVALSDPTAAIPFGRHEAPIRGIAAARGSDRPEFVVSGAADGTLRLWSLDTGTPLGLVAGPVGFHAVAGGVDRVVARDGDGRLWVLEAELRPPLDESEVQRLITVRHEGNMLGLVSAAPDPPEVEARFDVMVTVAERADLTAARLVVRRVTGGPSAQSGTLALQVERGDAALHSIDVLDAEGRLVVPRQLAAGRPVRIRAWQHLGPGVHSPGVHTVVTLALTLYSPVWGGEYQLELDTAYAVPTGAPGAGGLVPLVGSTLDVRVTRSAAATGREQA